MEPATADGAAPRGFLRVGGASVVRHQLALALAAGCEKIACHARGLGPELIALQREAERSGASFHLVAGPHGLSSLVTAADEVVVIGDGLLPTTGDALRLLGSGAVVLVQPAESGIPAGFERIDLNHAAAGLMLVPGRLVDRLMELPADVDPGSALLRIALQAGVSQRPVPDEVRLGGRWILVRSEAGAHDAEDGWMVRHTADCARTPGALLARTLVRKFGSALLHGGRSGLIGTAIAGVLAILGLAFCWFGWAAPGFVLAGIAWVLQRATAALEMLRREALALHAGNSWLDQVLAAAFDVILIAMLVVTIPSLPGELLIQRTFAPIVLIGLLRLLAGTSQANWASWCKDRLVLCLLLAAMAIGSVIETGVPALGVLLLATGLTLLRARSDEHMLTRA